jgi:hypothetical protein
MTIRELLGGTKNQKLVLLILANQHRNNHSAVGSTGFGWTYLNCLPLRD